MVIKFNNLSHNIDDEDKCMNTLLKELNMLSKGLNILHRNGMPLLYDDVRNPIITNVVKSSITMDVIDIKLF